MIAAFLDAESYSGRWHRDDRGDDPDPWAVWVLRAVALALAAFWGAIIASAMALLP